MAGITSITSASLGGGMAYPPLQIHYAAVDTFALDVNGFGGSSFAPIDRRGSISEKFGHLRKGNEELEIDTGQSGLSLVTFGRFSWKEELCFFAAGARTANFLVDGDYPFAGVADGVFVSASSGRTYRVYGSIVEGTIFANAREVAVTIRFTGRDWPFDDFPDSEPVDLGVATARIPYAVSSFDFAKFAGPGGSTGTITGQFHDRLASLSFVYELTYPNGDRMFGAAAAELAP